MLEERVAEFRVVVEKIKSDLNQVNTETDTLKAQLAVGRRAARPSPDCSAS